MEFFKNYIYIIMTVIILVLVLGKYLYILRKSNGKLIKGRYFSIIIMWLSSTIILYIIVNIFTGVMLDVSTGAYNSTIWFLIYIIPTVCSDMCFLSIVDNKIVGLIYKENLSDIETVVVEDWARKVKFTFNLKNGKTRTFKTKYNEELIEILKNENIEVKIDVSPDNYK